MRFIHFSCILFLSLFTAATAARAVTVNVDLSSQTMHVTSAAGESYTWPISSGRSGFNTPQGNYRSQRLEKMHYSRKYDMTPMPHSIFFRGGYAIHATNAVGALGRPASHGCIRLAPANAARLYQMVRSEGARIAINGTPGGASYAAKHKSSRTAVAHHRHMPASALAYAPRHSRPTLRQFWRQPGDRY